MKSAVNNQQTGTGGASSVQQRANQQALPINDGDTGEPPADSFATVTMQPVSDDDDTKPNGGQVLLDLVQQVQTWLSRAAAAKTFEERLVYLSQAVSLAPGQPGTRHRMYETLKPYLNRRPFLRYAHENSLLYRVNTAEGMALTVAK